MTEDFDFSKWCESNGFTAKTSGKLKQQDPAVTDALQRNSLYRAARIANLEGILRFSVPSIILVKAG